jgi:hypothetical protein
MEVIWDINKTINKQEYIYLWNKKYSLVSYSCLNFHRGMPCLRFVANDMGTTLDEKMQNPA